jgi:hypothetical protein
MSELAPALAVGRHAPSTEIDHSSTLIPESLRSLYSCMDEVLCQCLLSSSDLSEYADLLYRVSDTRVVRG